MKEKLLFLLLWAVSLPIMAQFRPPPFIGGIPGAAQHRALLTQRHQARTLLYREALDELRKNPKAADLPSCGPEERGERCLVGQRAAHTLAGGEGKRLALLIGNNAYSLPIPPLETPISDVFRIGGLLKDRFGYETRVVTDAGLPRMISEINRLAAEAGANDSVLIFYAGHGYLLEDIGMGFWIPTDASAKTAKGWISNQDIAKLLTSIRARQVILVSDSCYAGTLTKESRIGLNANVSTDDILQKRTVVVLSSGGDEPVSDEGKEGHSIFAWNLIKTLEQTGSLTPGARVWKSVHAAVTKEFPQEPQYGAVLSAGHSEGGEFLFSPR